MLAPCAFVFLGIMYREILMDINDMDGDRAAGVWTLPVVAGRSRALAVALTLFTAASAVAMWVATHGQGLAWAWAMYGLPMGWVRAAAVGMVAAVVGPVYRAAAAIYQNGFVKAEVSAAIDESMKPIGLGMILLAALA
jgi:4-hydroxybenzoate polyprenyltransferase